ncbi:MAG: hypothetical protein NXI20_22295 [bacterium]|jgi:hypothetical protein|nr:hypothetical protein [bacterium]
MAIQKYDKLIEWILSDDFELTQYKISSLIAESKFEIVDINTVTMEDHQSCTWTFREGMLFIKNFSVNPKVFLELTSFDHEKYLDFVIRLKNYLLDLAMEEKR